MQITPLLASSCGVQVSAFTTTPIPVRCLMRPAAAAVLLRCLLCPEVACSSSLQRRTLLVKCRGQSSLAGAPTCPHLQAAQPGRPTCHTIVLRVVEHGASPSFYKTLERLRDDGYVLQRP